MQTPGPESAQRIPARSVEPHTGRAFAVSVIGLVVLPVAVVGLVLSIIAFERAKRLGAATGLAVAGIVCGCVGCLALSVAVPFLLGYLAGYFIA